MSATAAWPSSVFDTPVLRGLDAPSRSAMIAAGRLVERAAATAIYREGDDSDSFFVVISGAVELRTVRRGDAAASVLRVARGGDSFGEEALLPGIRRRVTATTVGAVHLAEVPIAVFRRVTGRAADSVGSDREWRYLQRAAARDLLAASAFARELGAADVDFLLDAMRLERFERGARIFEAGDRADELRFVVDGLVQLQRDDDGRTSVTAYLSRGDFFGDQEVLAGTRRQVAAVAAGATWCATVPRAVVVTLSDRNPGLLPRLRRVADHRGAEQAAVVGAAAARSTQHVFHDLYRMQMARSLLAIDQDQCVRCGHCAWSCQEVHGVSRLVRRGDKVVTRLTVIDGDAAASLLLPSTCQHCRNAACMVDCPTGAIGRDPEGEVFIRPELCTGCGNCAKACPWGNIQMAPRPSGPVPVPVPVPVPASPEIAVKCELCRGFAAPACVEACPTGAILRLDPQRDVAEVAQVLGLAPTAAAVQRRSYAAVLISSGAAIAIVVGAIGIAMQRAGSWAPGRGAGLGFGVLTAALILALTAYLIPKRGVRRRMRPAARGARRDASAAPRSRTRPHLIAHVALGLIAPACALAHAGPALAASPGGALLLALALATVVGGAGALLYRLVPRALTRLERRGALPEDLVAEGEALQARLYRETSGKDQRVKRLAERILLPYARAPLGALALIASQRSLADEERRLRRRIEAILAGRGADLLADLDALVKLAVELRALPARRVLTALLRGWLPLHIVSATMVLALLVAHVVTAVS